MRRYFSNTQKSKPFCLQCVADVVSSRIRLRQMQRFRPPMQARHALALIAAASITAHSNASSLFEKTGSISDGCEFTRVYRSGSIVELQTASPGTTGYQWYPEPPQNIHLIEEGVVPADSPPGLVGAPARQWWRFEISGAAGQTAIDFFLYQVWEGKETAIRHCTVELTTR